MIKNYIKGFKQGWKEPVELAPFDAKVHKLVKKFFADIKEGYSETEISPGNAKIHKVVTAPMRAARTAAVANPGSAKSTAVPTPPADGALWAAAGFAPETAARWKAVGFSVDDSLMWAAARISPDVAALWQRAGLNAVDGLMWAKAGYSPRKVEDDRLYRQTPPDKERWQRWFTAEEIRAWLPFSAVPCGHATGGGRASSRRKRSSGMTLSVLLEKRLCGARRGSRTKRQRSGGSCR